MILLEKNKKKLSDLLDNEFDDIDFEEVIKKDKTDLDDEEKF